MMGFNRLVLLIIFCTLSWQVSAQLSGILEDSTTSEPIPYVNIWIENEMTGTTADERGGFSLTYKQREDGVIVFSAIGFKTKKVIAANIGKVVLLKPEVTHLKEVVVRGEKRNRQLHVEKFKKKKIMFFYGCSGTPWMAGRYFEFEKAYEQTPILQSVTLYTASADKATMFNLRLYTKNENGNPEIPVYSDNILVEAKKGNNLTVVDVSDKNIQFPLGGLLIAAEFLIIDQNKSVFKYSVEGNSEKLERIQYKPSFGAIPSDTKENGWIYNKGMWRNVIRNSDKTVKDYRGRYSLPAIALTLSN